MFISGRYRGHWDQMAFGRQAMTSLMLHFEEGRITGSGEDLVGKFSFTGSYDNQGNIRMVKHYLGRHDVVYEGRYDGEGTIHGTWSIEPFWSGTFALMAEPRQVADLPIQDL